LWCRWTHGWCWVSRGNHRICNAPFTTKSSARRSTAYVRSCGSQERRTKIPLGLSVENRCVFFGQNLRLTRRLQGFPSSQTVRYPYIPALVLPSLRSSGKWWEPGLFQVKLSGRSRRDTQAGQERPVRGVVWCRAWRGCAALQQKREKESARRSGRRAAPLSNRTGRFFLLLLPLCVSGGGHLRAAFPPDTSSSFPPPAHLLWTMAGPSSLYSDTAIQFE